MIKLETTIADEAFSSKRTHQYKLSILVGIDSFCYLVLNQENKSLLFKQFSGISTPDFSRLQGEQIHDIFNMDKLLKLDYGEVKLAFSDRKQVFVPNRIYNPAHKATYLKHVATTRASDQIYTNDITPLHAQNVFSVDHATLNFLQQMFPDMQCLHVSSALYLSFLEQTDANESRLFLCLRDNSLYLFLFQGRELIFSNNFHCQSSSDFIYYVMLVFNQFNLDVQRQVVLVSGNFVENGEYHKALSQYVQYIYPVDKPNFIRFAESIESRLNNHAYFDVMSIFMYH